MIIKLEKDSRLHEIENTLCAILGCRFEWVANRKKNASMSPVSVNLAQHPKCQLMEITMPHVDP